MSESDMRSTLVSKLRRLHAFPVENMVRAGVPDVAYTLGWLELKWARAWPVRASTPFKVRHWTRTQRRWHTRHHVCGGVSFVLLQVRHEWLLLTGPNAVEYLGLVPHQNLIDHTVLYWDKGMKWDQLRQFLLHYRNEGFDSGKK